MSFLLFIVVCRILLIYDRLMIILCLHCVLMLLNVLLILSNDCRSCMQSNVGPKPLDFIASEVSGLLAQVRRSSCHKEEAEKSKQIANVRTRVERNAQRTNPSLRLVAIMVCNQLARHSSHLLFFASHPLQRLQRSEQERKEQHTILESSIIYFCIKTNQLHNKESRNK